MLFGKEGLQEEINKYKMSTPGGGGGPNKLASLRAMFEKGKQEDSMSTSPPDRGRSPGVASAASSRTGGTSPRPLSKVRTSFIAVAGTAGLGLMRSDSTNSDNPARRSAFSMDAESNPKEMADTKETVGREFEARKQSTVISETIPENALETPAQTPSTEPTDKQLEVKSNGKPMNGKSVPGKTSPTKTPTGARTLKPAPVLTTMSKSSNGTSMNSPRSAGSTHTKSTMASAKPAAKPTTSSTRTKAVPAAISVGRISTAASKLSPGPGKSPAPKTPTTPKAAIPKQSPAKKTAPPAASKTSKTPEKKPSRSSLASNGSQKSPHKSPGHPLKTKEGSPSTFVKPKPKSPTKPVRLPASLTAPTASSRSKVSSTVGAPIVRSQSRATIAPSARSQAGAASSTGLRRTQSTLVKRSAIGPPPAKKEAPRPSVSGAADGRPKSSHHSVPPGEGFMARMMRPTASSQSKTHEKAPLTPPKHSQPVKHPSGKSRKSTSRPSTRDSTSGQKAFGGSPSVAKTTPKTLKSSEKLKEVVDASEPVEEAPKAEEPHPVAEAVHEAPAETAIIPDSPVVDIGAKIAPAEENSMFGEKTECLPITEKVDTAPISESPAAAATTAEVEEPKQEASEAVTKPTEEEPTPLEKEVAATPAIETAEAGKDGEASKSIDMGETF